MFEHFQVKGEVDGVLQVDLSVPPDEKMEWDQAVSMRDALVFLEHGWFKSSEATRLYPGGGRISLYHVHNSLTQCQKGVSK